MEATTEIKLDSIVYARVAHRQVRLLVMMISDLGPGYIGGIELRPITVKRAEELPQRAVVLIDGNLYEKGNARTVRRTAVYK